MRSRSRGYSLALSVPLVCASLLSPLLPGQEGTKRWFIRTLILSCINKAETGEGVTLSKTHSLLCSFWNSTVLFLFCFVLSWFGFILLFLEGDMVFFSRKRRTGLTCDLSGCPRLVLWLALFLLQRCILQGLSARCWQNSYRNTETLQTPILLKGETALYQGKAHNHCLSSWARQQ